VSVENAEFDVHAFITQLERTGLKLTAVLVADEKYRASIVGANGAS
jgi:hypothetical protein